MVHSAEAIEKHDRLLAATDTTNAMRRNIFFCLTCVLVLCQAFLAKIIAGADDADGADGAAILRRPRAPRYL